MKNGNGNGSGPKIVVIGGGSGSSTILSGLKPSTSNLTAIVTMFDSGGSTGLLRREFGYPPFGDLRRCLMALGDGGEDMRGLREALEYRFHPKSSLNGHSMGNLLLAALTSVNNHLEQALDELAALLRVRGQVIPVTLEQAELCAELEDGRLIQGESNIDLRGEPLPRIKRVFLDREVIANPRALRAIMEADVIVLGPGDLYTSVVPNLLPRGTVEAIASCRGTRVYVCNLMTKPGETDDFRAADFVVEMGRYLSPAELDWVLVNTAVPPTGVEDAYAAVGAQQVEPDVDRVGRCVGGVFSAPLAGRGRPLRHDPELTARAILSLVGAGRVPKAKKLGTASAA